MKASLRTSGAAALSVVLMLGVSACSGGGSGGSTPGTGGGGSPSTPPPPLIQDLKNQPPSVGALAILLTDGSVIIQAAATSGTDSSGRTGAGVFYRLTPDANGDYVNGTWSRIASPPAGYSPYAGASAVLADGRVLLVGGEYNQNNYDIPFAPSALTDMSAIYDPKADSWTMIPAPPGLPYIGDVASVVLPDGRFVFGTKLGKQMWALDPGSLTWSQLPAAGKADDFAEEGMTLLPSGGLLVVDMANTPHAEHYDPSLGHWIAEPATPVGLTSPTDFPAGITYGPAPQQTVGGVTYGPGPPGTYMPPGEIGPAILRPDGSVFATGSAASGQTGHTAIYRPGAAIGDPGTWTAGPDFASGDNAGDTSADLLPSGHVLVAGVSGALYEFDGTTLTKTVSGPGGSNPPPAFLLPLPSGESLVLVAGAVVRLYSPTGTPQAQWAPTITSAPAVVSRGGTYVISGTQFNGLSQAAAYGDELNSSTNFPLVRITNKASGHVVYARTHNHSTMAVATGAATVSTQFDAPQSAETGASTLVVVANGISSAPANLTVN